LGFHAPFSTSENPAGAATDAGLMYARWIWDQQLPAHGGAADRPRIRVIDAFSSIVRLGEGASLTGRLSEAAIARTFESFKNCRDKDGGGGGRGLARYATEAARRGSTDGFVRHDSCAAASKLEDWRSREGGPFAGLGRRSREGRRSTVMSLILERVLGVIWLGFDPRAARVKNRAGPGSRCGSGGCADETCGGVDDDDDASQHDRPWSRTRLLRSSLGSRTKALRRFHLLALRHGHRPLPAGISICRV